MKKLSLIFVTILTLSSVGKVSAVTIKETNEAIDKYVKIVIIQEFLSKLFTLNTQKTQPSVQNTTPNNTPKNPGKINTIFNT